MTAGLLGLISALSSIKDGVEFVKYINNNSDDPLSIAFENIVERFNDNIPDIREQLSDFLASTDTEELFQIIEDDDLSNKKEKLVQIFIQGADFHFGVDTFKKADEIVECFINEYENELFKSEVGNLVHEERANRRTHQLNKTIEKEHIKTRQDIKKLISDSTINTHLKEKWQQRIDEYKNITNEQGPKAVIPFWEKFCQEIKDEEGNSELLLEIYSNLAYCYWQIAEDEKASEYFIKSYHIDPRNKKAKLNRALAYLIDGNMKRAHEKADEVLSQEESLNALAVKGNILLYQEDYPSIIKLFEKYIDEETGKLNLDNISCFKVLGMSLAKKPNYDKAIKIYRQGLEINKKSARIKFLLASTLIDRVNKKSKKILSLSKKDYNVLLEAEDLLTEVIDEFKEKRLEKFEADALINRAIARIKLEKDKDAYVDAKRAKDINSKNSEIRLNYVRSCLIVDEIEEAIAELENLIDEKGDLEAISFLFYLYSNHQLENNLEKAKRIIEEQWPEVIENPEENLNDLPKPVLESYVELLINVESFEAELAVEQLLKKDSSNPKAKLLQAKLFYKQDREDAIKKAEEVLEFINEDNKRIQYEIAQFFCSIGEWQLGAEVFQKFELTIWSSPFLIFQAIEAMFWSNEVKYEDDVLKLASGFREERYINRKIAEMELNILQRRREVKEARKVLQELINEFSDNSRYRIQLALNFLRDNNSPRAEEEIEKIGKIKDLDDKYLMIMANIFYELEKYEKALEFAYEAWREGKNKKEIQLQYLDLILRKMAGKVEEDYFQIEKVKEETVVTLSLENGNKKDFLITSKEDSVISEEIHLSSMTAKKLLNKRVGEEITWRNDIISKTAMIEKITHKYLWAHQKAREDYLAYNPEDTSFLEFSIDPDNPLYFLEIIDKLSEPQENFLNLFKENNLPIGVLVNSLGKDSYDIWRGITTDEKLKLIFCQNSNREINREIKAIKEAKTIVMDSIALFTIQYIGLLDVIVDCFSNIIIPTHVYESIMKRFDSLKEFKESGHGTLGKDGDKYFMQEISPETVDRDISFLKNIIDFCDLNTEKTGRPRAYKSDRENDLKRVLGEEFLVPIMITEDVDGAVFYSDDEYLREIAFAEYKVSGFNIWILLEKLLFKNLITVEKHTESLIKLIDSNYKFVPISSRMLTDLALRKLDCTDDDYVLVMSELFNKNSRLISVIKILAQFIVLLLKRVKIFEQAELFLLDVLERISAHIGKKGVDLFYNLIRQEAKKGLVILPIFSVAMRIINDLRKHRYNG